jgi:hypothetical protein
MAVGTSLLFMPEMVNVVRYYRRQRKSQSDELAKPI